MTLTLEGIVKRYPTGTLALDGVSLEVAPGMFGLLGPNGAGKSTLMRVVATLLRPDAGTVRLGDIDALDDPSSMRAVLGYLPQEFGLYPNVPVAETLSHFLALKSSLKPSDRRDAVDVLLERTNLLEKRRAAVGTLSGGMRQRLGVAIALAGAPRLLVLDEPTAGLDPGERHRLYDVLAEVGEHVAVILSTHIVEDVRELCTALAIIDRGRVVMRGDPGSLVGELRGRLWRVALRSASDEATLRARQRVISVRRFAGRPVAHVVGDASPDEGATPAEPSLEDVYFHHLGARAEE